MKNLENNRDVKDHKEVKSDQQKHPLPTLEIELAETVKEDHEKQTIVKMQKDIPNKDKKATKKASKKKKVYQNVPLEIISERINENEEESARISFRSNDEND